MKWLFRAADFLRRPGRDAGRRGEDLAHRYLQARGYTVVARNYRPRSGHGEIDLIAWDGGKLVFVEVKTRSVSDFGAPERALDAAKAEAVMAAAREYTARKRVEWGQVRFDLVSVVLAGSPLIELKKGVWSPMR